MNTTYQKRKDETEKQYIFRICGMKEEIGNWEQVADIINAEIGKNLSSSAYRKPFQSWWEYFEDIKDNIISDEHKKSLQDLTRELQQERYKLQALKIPVSRYDRVSARIDLFLETFLSTVETLPLPEFEPVRKSYNHDKEYVLGMGDFHFGANFECETNSYSAEICKDRLSFLVSVLEEEVRKNDISKLKIINVADTVQGILRLTDLKLNEMPVVMAVVEVSRLLALFLNSVSKFCEIEYYHVTHSNHSQTRNLGSKANELVAEDLEKIIINYIADLLANNDRIQVFGDVNKDYIVLDIFDFKTLVLHGHQLKDSTKVIKDYSNLHREIYDYAFLGHRHSANEIIVGCADNHNIEIFTIPSFVGGDPYAESLGLSAKAMVKIFEFDKKYGHTGSKNIILN